MAPKSLELHVCIRIAAFRDGEQFSLAPKQRRLISYTFFNVDVFYRVPNSEQQILPNSYHFLT